MGIPTLEYYSVKKVKKRNKSLTCVTCVSHQGVKLSEISKAIVLVLSGFYNKTP
jgi:hypothetical protein